MHFYFIYIFCNYFLTVFRINHLLKENVELRKRESTKWYYNNIM